MDIIITDLSGHTFTIKLNWDIVAMKCDISEHYEEKYKTCFCNEKGMTIHEFNNSDNYRQEWYKSEYYKTLDNMYFKLIYKGEILEQYHIEADLITLKDFEEGNNLNVVIVKHDENNDDDNNSNVSSGSD